MALFKTKPNIDDHEKARIEFHLQEIAESIGFERFKKPVVASGQLLAPTDNTPDQIAAFVGDHLAHNTSGLKVQVAVEIQEQCGGGG